MAIKLPGQLVIIRFPQTDLSIGKPRPVLLIAQTPGQFDDWLLCMISRQLQQAVPNFDEIIDSHANDFQSSGLSVPSVVRLARLARSPSARQDRGD